MPTVAALVGDPAARQSVAEQIETQAEILHCPSVEGLADLVARGGLDAVVADLHDESGTTLVPAFAALRRHAPRLPLILFCRPTPAALREIPDLIALGGRGLDLVLQGADDLGLALKRVLTPVHVARPGETLARHIVPLVPGPFRTFFAVSALKASPRLRVGTAAKWSGLSRRTLERALHNARLPSAAAGLGSCTALHVAWWLDVQGWSPKVVASEMGFTYQSGLTRVLQRHFGCSVKTLPEEGGFAGLLARFEQTLMPPADALSA